MWPGVHRRQSHRPGDGGELDHRVRRERAAYGDGGSIVDSHSRGIGRLRVAWVLLFVVAGWPTIGGAGMLVPSSFTSLGAQLSETGSYQVDTNAAVLTLPDGRTISGVVSGGVAVFTFGSIDINGATFTFLGPNAFALLSQGNLMMTNVQMDLSASGATPGPGGDLTTAGQGGSSFWSAAGGGGFGGAGGQGGDYVYTGGLPPLGSSPSPWPGAPGGGSYGGLTGPIQGGSAGGDYSNGAGYASGGAGGGAVELARARSSV